VLICVETRAGHDSGKPTSISYVSVALSAKAAETEIRAVYRDHASGRKAKKTAEISRTVLGSEMRVV